MTAVDNRLNRVFSGARIYVEHAMAGVKRCRIVKDVFRNTKKDFSDPVMEVACALHNLRLEFRHPQPTFSLLDLSGQFLFPIMSIVAIQSIVRPPSTSNVSPTM